MNATPPSARLQGQFDAAQARVSQNLLDASVAAALGLKVPARPGFESLQEQQKQLQQITETLRQSLRAEIEVVISQVAEALMLQDPTTADGLLTTIDVPEFPGFIDLIQDLALLAGRSEAMHETIRQQTAEAARSANTESQADQQREVKPEQLREQEQEQIRQSKTTETPVKNQPNHLPPISLTLSAPPSHERRSPAPRPTWFAIHPQGSSLPVAATRPPNRASYEAFCHLPDNPKGSHLTLLVAGGTDIQLHGTNPSTVRLAAALHENAADGANTWRRVSLPLPVHLPPHMPLALTASEPFWVAWAGLGEPDAHPEPSQLIASPLPTSFTVQPAPASTNKQSIAVVQPHQSAWPTVNWGEVC